MQGSRNVALVVVLLIERRFTPKQREKKSQNLNKGKVFLKLQSTKKTFFHIVGERERERERERARARARESEKCLLHIGDLRWAHHRNHCQIKLRSVHGHAIDDKHTSTNIS